MTKTQHRKPGTERDDAKDARERIVRRAELALIELEDIRHGGLVSDADASRKRAAILRAANLTEEDLMQRPVFAAGSGGFPPDVDPKLTWDQLERHRRGEIRAEAIARGEVTGRSLSAALREHLASLKRPTERGPVAGGGAQAPRGGVTIEERLKELVRLEDQHAITSAQHEARAHEIRHGLSWTVQKRGEIETALSHLMEASIRGEVSEAEYQEGRRRLLDG